jgi:hypothetical protein
MHHRVGLGAGDRLLDVAHLRDRLLDVAHLRDRLLDVAHLRDGLPLRAELALDGYLARSPGAR